MNANSYKQLEERDDYIEELREQLAAIQAREQQLLKRIASTNVLLQAVCTVNPDSACAKYELMENLKTINSTSDTSTLEALIHKAGEVMRERCLHSMPFGQITICGTIRSLPIVKLEDLK